MIQLDQDQTTDLDLTSSREWLEANGLGGFACSTVSGANTRRYHGLLTAASKPPLGRVRLLSKYEETLRIGESEYELGTNFYPGGVHPEGHNLISSFRLDPFPVWTYAVGEAELEKRLFTVHGSNAVFCRWQVRPGFHTLEEPVELEIKPLVAFCDYHSIRRESDGVQFRYEVLPEIVVVRADGSDLSLFVSHNAREIEETGYWYRNFEYSIEAERGQDHREDLFQPFSLKFDLLERPAVAAASTEETSWRNADELESAERERRRELCEIADAKDDLTERLVLAADQFIVKRGERHSVLAGYPWFTDWGRDTMIALPGLTLATNREGIAREILEEYAAHISEGMIPNRFPDEGETPDYNTVDATLWFVEAVRAYVEKTGDSKFVKRTLYDPLTDIIEHHQAGTRYGIRADEDGLLSSGEEGSQLTWMDAKSGDETMTSRAGKPVEIQALWFNALRTVEDFAERFKDKSGRKKYGKLAKKAKKSFNRQFWNPSNECLFDVVGEGLADASIRPNQIFAASLEHSMLSQYRAKKVVQQVEKHLFTPFGLRTLEPSDPQYRGVYVGNPYERDRAYHQGTVWAWLTGAFIDAVRRTYPKGRKLKSHVTTVLSAFEQHLAEAGIGQISEIFDGDEPHHPRGCFAQAWSVAEILRILKDEQDRAADDG